MRRLSLVDLRATAINRSSCAPYDPARVTVGILHLGLGALPSRAPGGLHRTTSSRAIRAGASAACRSRRRARSSRWPRRTGSTPCSRRAATGTVARVIGSVRQALFAGADRAGLVERFADPRHAIVTATVTEKGYCHDPATGALNREHPDIVHDLAHPAHAGVGRRDPDRRPGASGARRTPARSRSSAATTCRTTGAWCRDSCTRYARERDPALARLDRRSRRVSLDDGRPHRARDDRRRPCGRRTPRWACTMQRRSRAERFGQWVDRGCFAGARPAWEEAGAQFVADVAPFETMKLRLLERQPFHAGLSRLPVAPRFRLAGCRRDPLLGNARRTPDVRGDFSTRSSGRPETDLPDYCATIDAALSATGRCRTRC